MPETRVRDTARLVRTLFLTAAALIVTPPIGVILAAVLFAVAVVRSRFDLALAIAAGAFVLGWVMPAGSVLAGGVNALLVFVAGGTVGAGLRQGWPYGRIVTVTTAGAVIVVVGALASVEPALSEFNARLGEVLDSPDRAEYNERVVAVFELWRWLIGHWHDVFAGFAFAGALVCACITVSGTVAWLNASETPVSIPGAFRLIRPPDWAVWFVIAAALMWFADQRWPNDIVRMTGWNAAVALFGLYWVNGMSLAVYAVHAFKPNAIVVALLVLAGVLLNLASLLGIIGLFDTWAEFRRRVDEALAARALREDSRDDSL